MHADPAIFRRYDIRGVAGSQLSEELAEGVAKALGSRIRRSGGTSAALGRDVRESSPSLARAVARGFAATGLRVLDLGVVPTPVWMHGLVRLGAAGGIMVTGSHNPRQDNGLKCSLGTSSLWGDDISSLRTELVAGEFEQGAGSMESVDWLPRYTEELIRAFPLQAGMHVAVDCGNGVMGPVVLDVLKRQGCRVEALYCEPDGTFPNHIPDPEVPRYMQQLGERVRASGAVAGLGFDGDGDRIGILDEQGVKHAADRVLALFAEELLPRHPGGIVRFDVKCSDFLDSHVRALGGRPVMGETGHSLLKRDIKQLGAVLGGELSGHIIINEGWPPIDDSLLNGLFFLSLLQRSGRRASELFARYPQWASTSEIKLPCADGAKEDVVSALSAMFERTHEVLKIDGARVRTSEGWFLVRASNTTPNLTVRLEAPTHAELLRLRDQLVAALATQSAVDARPLHVEIDA
jgi:phosphomannomutase/phosphoglucomutase